MRYGMARLSAMQDDLHKQRERSQSRAALVKSLVLAPVTGGLSLINYFRSRRSG